MEPGNSEFVSDAESKGILDGDKNEIEGTLEERKPGKYALKSLIRSEKNGDNRQEVIDLLEERLSEEKVLDQLNSLSHQLSETKNLLERINASRHTADLKTDKITDKTVKELRQFLKDNSLSENQLQELLEEERSNKDRKTAKKYIKNELDSTDSDSSLENLREDLSELENDVSNFRKEIDENREEFKLSAIDRKTENEDSRKETSQKELLEITNRIVEKLQERDDLRENEHLKALVNDAFLALEAENYTTFKNKLHEIENLGENGESSSENLEDQEEKLERMESIVSELEDRQKESLGIPEENTKEVNKNLEELEQVSGVAIERPDKVAKEKKIEELVSKGFQEEKLRKRSYSDLKKLDESSKEANDIDSKLKAMDKEKSDSMKSYTDQKTSEIEENIEKLEESLKSEDEGSSNGLNKLENKLKSDTGSEKKGLLDLI